MGKPSKRPLSDSVWDLPDYKWWHTLVFFHFWGKSTDFGSSSPHENSTDICVLFSQLATGGSLGIKNTILVFSFSLEMAALPVVTLLLSPRLRLPGFHSSFGPPATASHSFKRVAFVWHGTYCCVDGIFVRDLTFASTRTIVLSQPQEKYIYCWNACVGRLKIVEEKAKQILE